MTLSKFVSRVSNSMAVHLTSSESCSLKTCNPFRDLKSQARSRNISSSSSQPTTSRNSRLHQHLSQQGAQDWSHDEKQFSDPQIVSSPKPQRKKKRVIFTKEVIYTLLITNLLSIILGAGLGIWLSKRGHNAKILVPITASSLL